jgi:hypothetical protein
VISKHPGHFTSNAIRIEMDNMKNEFGAWTSFLSLRLRPSVAGAGFNRTWARSYGGELEGEVK